VAQELPDRTDSAGGSAGPQAAGSVERAVHQHAAAVYGYALRLTGNHADAEDIAQQTFLTLVRKHHQVRAEETMRGWLLAVARSAFLRTKRKVTPTPASNLPAPLEELVAAKEPPATIDRDQLGAAIAALAPEYRLPLLMFYFEELSYREIAAQLELPIGTVMSRLSRAKQKLRAALADDEESHA